MNLVLSKIGESFSIRTIPMLNIKEVIFQSISFSFTGVTASRGAYAKFSYSIDGGVVFTDYKELDDKEFNQLNQLLFNDNKRILVIDFLFTRIGADTTGEVTLTNIEIPILKHIESRDYNVFKNNQLFSEIDKNTSIQNLSANVVEKLYNDGILAKYLTRNESENNNIDDIDFVVFWDSINYLFSTITNKAFQFENLFYKKDLLKEYLRQKNIILSGSETIEQLQSIICDIYYEFRSRGSFEIFFPKDKEYSFGRRTAYRVVENPDGFEITNSTPIFIDGIAYNNSKDIPKNFCIYKGLLRDENTNATVNGFWLIQPDLNYRDVEILDITSPITITKDSVVDYDVYPKIKLTTKILLRSTKLSGVYKTHNGEYLRLINYQKEDFFGFWLYGLNKTGWWIGKSSPSHKSLSGNFPKGMILGYETNQIHSGINSFNDLEQYPIR